MLLYLLFIIGFLLLVKGADFLVDGASAIAKKLNVSDIVIGLTVVSVGTSSPELFVNLTAAAKGTTDLAIGNILGSNIANIFLILGITAIIYPIRVSQNTIRKETPFSLLAVICVGVLANDALINGARASALQRIDGIILLLFFGIFMYYLATLAMQSKADDNFDCENMGWLKAIGYVVIGLVGLAFGSNWIVDGAVHIAKVLGISEKVIGLSMIAFGTSLPELAASVAAARKKKIDLAVGNVIGSNIFNVFLILGISSTIRPLPFDFGMNVDIGMAIFSNLIIFIFMLTGSKRILDRWEGIVMVVIYLSYITYLYAL